MKHARADYQRIQDPAGIIPDDEPVFLLRGQDVLAPALVMKWAEAARFNGVDPAMVEAATTQARRMAVWQDKRRWKLPDMPEGAEELDRDENT